MIAPCHKKALMIHKSLTLIALTLGASACNTVKGVGKGIQSVGQAGEDAIKKQTDGSGADWQGAPAHRGSPATETARSARP